MKKTICTVFITSIVITGCSNPFSKVEPKTPSMDSKTNIKVVETVEQEPESYVGITSKKTVNVVNKPKVEKKVKETYHKIKPEPFSVDSKESDPELLGDQGTLKSKLETKDEDI